jgi:hypothetical protein
MSLLIKVDDSKKHVKSVSYWIFRWFLYVTPSHESRTAFETCDGLGKYAVYLYFPSLCPGQAWGLIFNQLAYTYCSIFLWR